MAGRIIISNHHKNTSNKFSNVISDLYNYKDINTNNILINKYLYDLVLENKDLIDKKIDYNRDYLFDFFGFKTLEKSYLLKINRKIVERPQHLLMRTKH